jgi:hypothetical protein
MPASEQLYFGQAAERAVNQVGPNTIIKLECETTGFWVVYYMLKGGNDIQSIILNK